jgi:acyl carrier protein
MMIRKTILGQMASIASQQHKSLKPLTDDLALLDSGLDSLCLAVLVASLDDELGIDPFSIGEGAEIPATVGDFISLYEAAAAMA